jgi:hypothetical protein
MILVAPIEELAAETPGIFDAAEALRKPRLILQSLEVAFGERIVVGRVRTIMRGGDAEIAGNRVVAFAFIGPPRSGWSVS